MSFNASAAVVFSFSSADICSIEASVSNFDSTEQLELAERATADSDNKKCCTSAHALYPPFTVRYGLSYEPTSSLALIVTESARKASFFVQTLYKPPIG